MRSSGGNAMKALAKAVRGAWAAMHVEVEAGCRRVRDASRFAPPGEVSTATMVMVKWP